MALWRVLDITSGFAYARPFPPPQTPPHTTRHNKKRPNQSGNLKSGFVRRLSTKPRFFYVATFVFGSIWKFFEKFCIRPTTFALSRGYI